MKLLFKPDPFIDSNNEYIELDPIEITELSGGCEDIVNLQLEVKFNEYWSNRISVYDIKDIQSEIEKIWNTDNSVLLNWRNN